MTPLLAVLFFVTAILYAAVGFGGGSTYNALLVLNGVDYRVLPTIALACNIIVVSGGVWRFSRRGQLEVSRLWPFLITSIPAAFAGGRLPISETVFIGVLGSALLASGLRLATQPAPPDSLAESQNVSTTLALMAGFAIGLLSGLVGIGGGIFLAPVLYIMRWGTPQKIAAACSLFILFNSISGLFGQALKLNDLSLLELAWPYWPLLIAVFLGGQIGSWAVSERLPALHIKRLTAVLILYVASRLLYRWLQLVGWV